ncbi:hypothetical protein [Arthrobacter sp. efr-133-R2A-120]|nr:hypothetical protein [Arthrobacter sp. efr-133-R2A-120]
MSHGSYGTQQWWRPPLVVAQEGSEGLGVTDRIPAAVVIGQPMVDVPE